MENQLNNPHASPVQDPDDRLIQQALAGRREARQQLFERHRDVAYQAALRITGRHEDALDVVQDGFIKAFERLAEFAGQASFRTWLVRIVSNRALDVLRARKVRLAVSVDGDVDEENRPQLADPHLPGPGHGLEQQELAQRLARAIETLPPDQRGVFSLYASGEMTYGQIAEALGIPIGTVMSRLYHARRKLHEQLADLAPLQTESQTDERSK